jgi:hypothetical protein
LYLPGQRSPRLPRRRCWLPPGVACRPCFTALNSETAELVHGSLKRAFSHGSGPNTAHVMPRRLTIHWALIVMPSAPVGREIMRRRVNPGLHPGLSTCTPLACRCAAISFATAVGFAWWEIVADLPELACAGPSGANADSPGCNPGNANPNTKPAPQRGAPAVAMIHNKPIRPWPSCRPPRWGGKHGGGV